MTEERNDRLSQVVTNLMKGILYREEKPALWESLVKIQSSARDYVKVMGLDVIIVEEEGFAYLATRETGEGEAILPRLIARRSLSYPVSLLLVLFRRKMTEMDRNSGETRLILDKDEVADMVSTFFETGANEVKFLKRVDSYIQKIHDLGFIRYLGERREKIEVKRIITSFIDAQWLSGFDEKLAEYRRHGSESGEES